MAQVRTDLFDDLTLNGGTLQATVNGVTAGASGVTAK